MKFTSIFVSFIVATATTNAAVLRRANLQTFTGTLGGAATPVENTGDSTRPFSVKGDTFVNLKGALERSCDQQFNACANQANSGASFSVADCTTQKDACNSADASVQA